jgi:uncharacterized membrane protein YphA (DoxX/SURF4 family)
MIITFAPFVLFILGLFCYFFDKNRNKLNFSKFDKKTVMSYFVLFSRWYLGYYMIDYGCGKLTGEQFNVSDTKILQTPLKDVNEFYIAWFLFGKSYLFNYFVGLFQLIGGILIIFNRTVLLGAILLLPIISTILLIDIAFTTSIHGYSLVFRLAMMLIVDLLIILYYKTNLLIIIKKLTKGIDRYNNLRWYNYLMLPLIGLSLDLFFALFTYPIRALFEYFLF